MVFCDMEEKARTSSAEAMCHGRVWPRVFVVAFAVDARSSVLGQWWSTQSLTVDAGVGSEDLSFCDGTVLRQSQANR